MAIWCRELRCGECRIAAFDYEDSYCKSFLCSLLVLEMGALFLFLQKYIWAYAKTRLCCK